MGNDYMTSGDNLRMIGHAFAAKRAVDQTAANYQAHIDKLNRKLAAMSKELEQSNELFDELAIQRDAWKETCRELSQNHGVGTEKVMDLYHTKKAQVQNGRH